MSNRILSLALKITGDASGVRLTPVERALQRLGEETAKVGSIFDKFAKDSELGAKAQADFAAEAAKLTQSLKDGSINSQQYADAFASLADAARDQATALEEGRRITEQYRTEEEKRAIALERLDRLLEKSAIDQETYNRAVADASGANAEAARAAAEAAQQQAEAAKVQADALRQRQALESRAAQIISANLTAQERYEQSLTELNDLQRQGLLTQDQYNRAVAAARKPLDDAAAAAERSAEAGKQSALKFNELSGIFAVLPGPLGSIAGRISGIASASEGLGRIFAGGLSSGISNVVGSFAALVNPVTLALGGIAAFGAAATAVAQGLVSLEDRVERLGRLANQLGVSFEFVQTLEEAGRRADVSIEQLSGSFARLQNTLAGADEESKKAAAALERLGVSVSEFGALSEEQRIELIGEKLAQIEDPAQRSAAAIALFGRSGVQLLPFFNELELAASDMERFGRAVTDLDRERLAAFGGGLDALSLSAQGIGTSLLLPFTGLAEGISFALAEITAGITAIVDPIGRILQPILSNIGRIIEALGVALGNIGRVIGAVFEPFAVVVDAVYTALEPLYELFLDLQRSLGDAVVQTVEWLVSFTPIGQIAANVGALGETIGRVVTIITTAFQRVGEFVGGLVSRFNELIAQSPFLQTLGEVVSSVFGSVASVFSTIANAIGGVVGRLLTIAENFLGIDRSAQQAADATQSLGSDIEELTEEERKQAAEREKFLQGFTNNVSKAIDESAKFGQSGFDAALQYQTAIDELQRQFDAGILNETSFRQEAEKASAAYTAQIDVIKQAAAETEAITKRVDGLLAKANELSQAEQDLNAVEAEIARVQAAIVSARAAGQGEQADALVARLAQLDQLQAGLEQQADEAAQGFAQGFDAAFASVDSGINSLIDKASEFGNEGALAASQLQEGIAAAQEQVRDGILNREAFQAEVDRQKKLFEDRVKDLQQAEKIAQDIAARQEQLREREFEIQLAREEELANVRTGSVQIQDIRSGGISAFFDTLKEDPAIAEAKKTNKELEQIRKGINKLEAEKVDILAGTG